MQKYSNINDFTYDQNGNGYYTKRIVNNKGEVTQKSYFNPYNLLFYKNKEDITNDLNQMYKKNRDAAYQIWKEEAAKNDGF